MNRHPHQLSTTNGTRSEIGQRQKDEIDKIWILAIFKAKKLLEVSKNQEKRLEDLAFPLWSEAVGKNFLILNEKKGWDEAISRKWQQFSTQEKIEYLKDTNHNFSAFVEQIKELMKL
ncbi:MAG: hypothetical protein QW303_07895 [Nitrososphaerota archaeon]